MILAKVYGTCIHSDIEMTCQKIVSNVEFDNYHLKWRDFLESINAWTAKTPMKTDADLQALSTRKSKETSAGSMSTIESKGTKRTAFLMPARCTYTRMLYSLEIKNTA